MSGHPPTQIHSHRGPPALCVSGLPACYNAITAKAATVSKLI